MNLRVLKTRAGKTQKEIAEIIGVKHATYAAWEEGRSEPAHNTLIRIAEIHTITLDDLCRKDLSRVKPQKQMENVIVSKYHLATPPVKNAINSLLGL